MQEPCLLPGEKLEDLQYQGLKLIQGPGAARFSADSVLLAAFASPKPGEQAVDLGAGCGVIALLCAARTGAQFCCVEQSLSAADAARRSMACNGKNIPVYGMGWEDAPQALGYGRFGVAVSNPPYFSGQGTKSPQSSRREARSGGEGCLPGLCKSAGSLLKNGGRFFLCYPASLLAEVFFQLRRQSLEPKRLQPVYAKPGKAPYLALIEAKKGGKPGLVWETPLLLQDASGMPPPAIRRIYHMDDQAPTP